MVDASKFLARFDLARLQTAAGTRFGCIVLFFALVASLRLVLIHFFGADIPYSDQWDSEIWNWVAPYQTRGINWNVLFLPHNEHRIALVRLFSLALFILNNNQWDNLVEAVVDVFFVATVCSLALRALLAHLERDMWPLAVFLVAACCLPCGHENFLTGFQVQVYLLIALAISGVWLAASRPVGIAIIAAIAIICVLSLFTMASGLFTAPAIGVALALRLWTARMSWRGFLPLAAISLAMTAVGYRLLVHLGASDPLHAQDLCEWLQGVKGVGSWPLPPSWISLAVVWLPFAIGSARLLRQRLGDAADITAAALGVWTILQIAGIAYGRGHDLAHIHSRYTDILALTVLVNAFFCLRLMQSPLQRLQPKARVAIACGWLAVMGVSYLAQGALSFVDMQMSGDSRRTQEEVVRRYVQDFDKTAVDSALPWNVPYPNKQRLKLMLDDKTVRDVLPAGVRPPLSLGAYTGGFSVNGMPATVTRPRGAGAYGSYASDSGNRNTADLTSPDLHSRLPYLQFAVAGQLGAGELSLSIDAAKGNGRRNVVPRSTPGESWATVIAAPPAADFRLHARDDDVDHWFAYAAPIEMGRLSLWTHRLLDASPVLLFLTLWLMYFLAQFNWLSHRLAPAQPVNAPPVEIQEPAQP